MIHDQGIMLILRFYMAYNPMLQLIYDKKEVAEKNRQFTHLLGVKVPTWLAPNGFLVDVCNSLGEYASDALWAIEAEGVGIQESVIWLKEHRFIDQEIHGLPL